MFRALVFAVSLFALLDCSLSFAEGGASSEESRGENVLAPVDLEVISQNGSITRATCPHSCSQRGIPKENCREWRSKMYGDKCYVEDLRSPSTAIPLPGAEKK